ncbi:HPr family phosphocarrier protein, partial [Salmonella enterica]
MIRQKVRVMNSTGLHARPAATLAKIVKKYQSSLTLVNNDKEIPIKGMMSILGAGVKGNTMNRPGFPGECFICELRLPDHRFRWKHNKL